LRRATEDLEKAYIARALRQTGGNRSQAAQLLGISRRALFRKLAESQVPITPMSGDIAHLHKNQ
jgi:DNA-binding NtrC family response regulator